MHGRGTPGIYAVCGSVRVIKVKMKKNNVLKKGVCLLLLTFLALLFVPSAAREVKADNPVTVTFLSFNGKTSKTFERLNMTVNAGTAVQLPQLPKVQNHYSLGWSYNKRATSANFSEGQTIVVDHNITLYSAYRKIHPCELTFTSNKGKSKSKIFTSLNLYGNKGDVVKLPAPPRIKGYKAIGWTTKKGKMDPLYRAGDKFKITKKQQYIYGVYIKDKYELITLTIRKLGGDVMGTAHLVKGGYVKLPALRNTAKWAMLGYADEPMQMSNPKYLAGDMFRLYEDTDYYVVASRRSSESNLTAGEVDRNLQLAKQKFDHIIFVGDSRTFRMEQALKAQFGMKALEDVSFIYQSAQGLEWLRTQGYAQLMQSIQEWNAAGARRTAVIFNLGINDLSNINNYISYMNSVAPSLKAQNCSLYYMSLNPINSKVLNQLGAKTPRTEADVRNFNYRLKTELPSYQYMDTYSFLVNNGFYYDAGVGSDNGMDDGLHYSTRTYKRIYDFALNHIATH